MRILSHRFHCVFATVDPKRATKIKELTDCMFNPTRVLQLCRAMLIMGRGSLALHWLRRQQRSLSVEAAKSSGFPRYLIALFGSACAAGVGVVGVLVLTHEPKIREAVELVAPAVVSLVRDKIGFADENISERQYRAKLQQELFSDAVCIRAGAENAELRPRTGVSEACRRLSVSHHLDLTADDLPPVVDDATVEDPRSVTNLEKLATSHGAPSLWAVPHDLAQRPLSAQTPQERKQALEALEERKRILQHELTSGRRDIDDVNAELRAIDQRRRELRGSLFSFFS